MLQKIKEFLKRILPPPVKSFMREVNSLRELIAIQSKGISEEQRRQGNQVVGSLDKLTDQQRRSDEKLTKLQTQQFQLLKLAEEQKTLQEQLIRELAFQRRFLLKLTDDAELQGRDLTSLLGGQERITAALAETEQKLAAQQAAQEAALLGGQERITAALAETEQKLAAQLTAQEAALLGGQERITAALAESHRQHGDALREMAQEQAALVSNQAKTLADGIEKTRAQAQESKRNSAEAMWAEIFNNTITGSVWLTNQTFSPGRWAVGYQNLYVMYRVLNETRPKKILELGLGQSTRMFSQYAAAYQDVEHLVVENDPDWIRFFEKDFQISQRSRILQFDCGMVPYKEAEAVRIYDGFTETFAGQKFDFISIDAPWSGDMKQYARIDILRMLPECLSEDFVILFDDCDRLAETRTLKEMENVLQKAGVAYKRGRYSGKKDCVLLCAEHMGFLATM